MSAFQMYSYLHTGAGNGQMPKKQNHGWRKKRAWAQNGIVFSSKKTYSFQVWWSEALDLNHLLHKVALHPIILCISR